MGKNKNRDAVYVRFATSLDASVVRNAIRRSNKGINDWCRVALVNMAIQELGIDEAKLIQSQHTENENTTSITEVMLTGSEIAT